MQTNPIDKDKVKRVKYHYEPSVVVRNSRIYYQFQHMSINLEVDITPVYDFFKEMFTTNWHEELKNLKKL